MRQSKGNLWKYISELYTWETYPENKSREFNKHILKIVNGFTENLPVILAPDGSLIGGTPTAVRFDIWNQVNLLRIKFEEKEGKN